MISMVALDIETTGLDPQADVIIEIGAVRFNARREEGEWTTLINPGRHIPPFITQLTGITDQMIVSAPPLRAVLSELSDFIGDSIIVGHNIGFDLSFLHKHGILRDNDCIDTYELAAVLLPTAGRYNLSSLGQILGIPLPATHRALDDARVTRAAFLQLYEKALELPLPLLAEIVRLAETTEWKGYRAFYEALRARSKETVPSQHISRGTTRTILESLITRNYPPLSPSREITPLDPEEVAAVLDIGGQFAHYFPAYEYRPQQVEMLRAVTRSLSESRHLMVEAGTGTGKSMAYLIPAALWSLQNGLRVVISTNTINLQDQLINKDVPDMCAALGLNVNAAVMKGRSNYLCPRRLENIRRRDPDGPDELRVLAKVLVWLQSTHTGDRSEINLNGPIEREIWLRFSAEDEGCTTENCLKQGGICPFYQARQAAQAANLLIVNHALLLADVATGNRILPDYDYVILDEAHHLEEAVTNALSFKITQALIERALRELGGVNSGVLGRLLTTLEGNIIPEDYASLNNLVQQINDLSFHFNILVQQFFRAIEQFLFEQREGQPVGLYAQQERILPATRTQPAWADIETTWDEADHALDPMVKMIGHLVQSLGESGEALSEEVQEVFGGLSSLYRRFSEIQANLNGLVFKAKPDIIYWVETNANGRQLSLNAAPLHVGPLIQKYLWHEKSVVIMTSATLTAAGEFDYLRGRLYAEEVDELAVGSPFDYESATLLFIANDIPEPNDRHGHQRAIEQGILKLCLATEGRALVLFTSYDQLKRTSHAISPLLAKHEIRVYEQGEGASANVLLESFRADNKAVLLGTKAFWEGVDVPGEALSALVITKLPFDVPSDPIVSARAETFDDPFNQYSLPEAILRFRQGFGRLIRTQSDRGIVAILDRRVLTKRYGRLFIDSLPTCTMQVGALADLPKAATKWLNL
jgi:DNA polymerase-3 subunit epsilon/ATP-dependent DNA helicase DinG